MKIDQAKYARYRINKCLKEINSTLVENEAVLTYWFEQLDYSKLDLLRYGKLALVAGEAQGVPNNEN